MVFSQSKRFFSRFYFRSCIIKITKNNYDNISEVINISSEMVNFYRLVNLNFSDRLTLDSNFFCGLISCNTPSKITYLIIPVIRNLILASWEFYKHKQLDRLNISK